MIILRALAGLTFSIAFFILLFLIAWYIALPLLLIFLVIGAIGAIRNKLTFSKFAANKGFDSATQLHRTRRVKDNKKNDIIDVDFTEV